MGREAVQVRETITKELGQVKERRIHHLKTHPEEFYAVVARVKTAEVRVNDRDYKVDDILHLQEYVPGIDHYTGADVYRLVTHVLDKPQYVKEGTVVMSIRTLTHEENYHVERLYSLNILADWVKDKGNNVTVEQVRSACPSGYAAAKGVYSCGPGFTCRTCWEEAVKEVENEIPK